MKTSAHAMPRTISVVIPSYNAARYIAATLQSIQAQNMDGVEVVLIDGASKDDTLNIARSFSNLDMTIVSERDQGQLDALQKGLRLARNDIILWLNADDIVMPGAFAAVRKAFEEHDVDFVYSDDVAFNEDQRGYYYGPPIKGLNDLDHFLFYRQLCSECVYWKRDITKYLTTESFDFKVYTDYAFFLNMRWKRRGLWLPKRLGAFRIREGQASSEFRERGLQEYHRIKAMHRTRIGMSLGAFRAAQIAYYPWFAIRQNMIPQVKRALRRVIRYMTNDAGRLEESAFFFGEWLLPLESREPR